LKTLTQPVNKFNGAIQRFQFGNHFLNIGKPQIVFIQNTQTLLHQHVIIGDIAGGGTQFLDAGQLSKSNPYFRNQYTFKIKTRDFHNTTPQWINFALRLPIWPENFNKNPAIKHAGHSKHSDRATIYRTGMSILSNNSSSSSRELQW